MTTPSNDLMEFALFALDHAADSVLPSSGPLVPFCLIEVGGERKLTRFLGDLEEGQQAARDKASQTPGAERAAVAWDGYLTVEGTRTDAVFVEASERGDSESVILAQRYTSGERAGNPVLVGRGTPLFGA